MSRKDVLLRRNNIEKNIYRNQNLWQWKSPPPYTTIGTKLKQEHRHRRDISSANLEQSDIIWQPPSKDSTHISDVLALTFISSSRNLNNLDYFWNHWSTITEIKGHKDSDFTTLFLLHCLYYIIFLTLLFFKKNIVFILAKHLFSL